MVHDTRDNISLHINFVIIPDFRYINTQVYMPVIAIKCYNLREKLMNLQLGSMDKGWLQISAVIRKLIIL